MLSASLDKATYAPGDTITLTVTSDKRLTNSTLNIQAASETFAVTVTVQSQVKITDSLVRTWTLKSDNGSVAVYTTTA